MSVRGLRRFQIPQGLYRLRTGILNNQLQRLYSRYMNGALTKAQVNLAGQRYITDMGETLKRDVGRWLRRFKQGAVDPDTWTEIDAETRRKRREWEAIVDDM